MASSSQLSFDDDPDIYSLPAVHGDDGSSESTSSSDDDKVPEKKARGKNREFVLHREFNSKQAYDAWWQEERSNWRAGEAYGTSSADVENFRCKYSRYGALLHFVLRAHSVLIISGESTTIARPHCASATLLRPRKLPFT